ncbi:MAG: fumarylacetoacetate hydrolase family protein [Spirochaetaceae bacterium]|jgi:2-keto-4-pentenoate hydratase/2-oxohepta-3-ene-1,7-dioic acid hydratase in catechol pathway|nr:fumarylacetoacetate hydrolase family protein [Spirochaetaceae bacterium]
MPVVLPVAGGDKKITLAPTKIIGVGFNYREHLKESRTAIANNITHPTEPALFAKTPNVLIGPGEAIVLPAHIAAYHFDDPRIDLEAELGIIIGRRGRHIREEEAYDYILGYTCFNDVSQRNIQRADVSGWFRGKSFDTFGPIGPAVVLHKDIGDPQNLAVRSRINGETKQSGNTQDMIFSIKKLIAYISENFTLEEGDIIATGTPSGISPLEPGDTVEIEIENIGILKNPVKAE